MNTTHCIYCGEQAHLVPLACPRIHRIEWEWKSLEAPAGTLSSVPILKAVEFRNPNPHHESWTELDEATRHRKIRTAQAAAGSVSWEMVEMILHAAYDTV